MDIDSTGLIYFSPTKTTKIVVEAIARGIGAGATQAIDLTAPESKTRVFDEVNSGLAIIGAPVYSGRIPLEAMARLRRIRANHTPAVLVVLYGNREFDDALFELHGLAVSLGFKPVAGAAFIGEHSFSNQEARIAIGRPDAQDLKKAEQFGAKVRAKLKGVKDFGAISGFRAPGKHPLRERMQPTNTSPVTIDSRCTRCGLCVEICPTAAITLNDRLETDPGLCIICCACIKTCPEQARIMEDPQVKQIVDRLIKYHTARKEPEVFL